MSDGGSADPVNPVVRDVAGAALLALFMLAAITGALLPPERSVLPDFDAILSGPTLAHLLGTDELGRDVLSRIAGAASTSLVIAGLGVGGAVLVGTVVGLLAGGLGGWPDRLAMRVVDVVLSFPGVLLALALASVFGATAAVVTLSIAVIQMPSVARIVRARALVLRGLPLIEAEAALGFAPWQIYLGTFLPHVAASVVVQASLLFGSAIIMESYLSFLGLGVQPPTPTFGGMLHEALGYLDTAPWLALVTTGSIVAVVLGFNLAGDALQDRLEILDP